MIKKIITCTGYYGTGSSAVSDLFLEFSNCCSLGDYELRFIQEPGGIRDLEYNLIENNHRHNTSNAIKEFIRYTDHLNGDIIRKGYKRFWGDSFKKLTKEYINHIVELKTENWWNYDQYSRGILFNDLDLIYKWIGRKLGKEEPSMLELLHEKGYYSAIEKEAFYKYTQKYISELLNSLDTNGCETVVLDQLLPPSNINQYIHYFQEELKIIVVDRDPRDCYLLEAANWKTGIIPYKKVEDFCKWFEIIRKQANKDVDDPNMVLRVRFEDMIYDYETTIKRIIEFVGLGVENHIKPKSCFNPAVSINNTNLKRNYPEFIDNIQYIEEHLASYLYKFPD